MKKFLALLLSVLMLLTLTAAFAEDGEATVTPNLNPVTVSFTKEWKFAIPVGNTLTFPIEFVSNSITGDATLPETASGEGSVVPTSVTLELTADKHDKGVYTVPFTVNLPKEYGTYIYKITEKDPKLAHVTCDDGAIYFAVMYTNAQGLTVSLISDPTKDAEGAGLEVTDKAVDNNNDTKNDGFENQYDVGSFQVTKTITGNASNAADKFVIEVTFTAPVDLSMLNITLQAAEGDTVIITELPAGKTVKKTFEIGHGETLAFDNIPQGVTVTVKETNQVNHDGLNYYVATYTLDGEKTEAVEFEIDGGGAVVAITNDKSTDIPTGVELDSIPYIVLMAVAVLGAVAFIVKRRMAAADED